MSRACVIACYTPTAHLTSSARPCASIHACYMEKFSNKSNARRDEAGRGETGASRKTLDGEYEPGFAELDDSVAQLVVCRAKGEDVICYSGLHVQWG